VAPKPEKQQNRSYTIGFDRATAPSQSKYRLLNVSSQQRHRVRNDLTQPFD